MTDANGLATVSRALDPESTAAGAAKSTLSRFDGRMAEWRNDDLLFTQAQRDLVEADYPGAVAVFDFPELRAHFGNFDAHANLGRRRRQRRGLTVILFAAFGATLAAVLPMFQLLNDTLWRWVFVISALVSVTGLAWGSLQILSNPVKEAWLQSRMCTERLRQFYFQLMLSQPELAARAMHNAAALREWKAYRRGALKRFEAWLGKPRGAELAAVVADVNHRCAWFSDAWRTLPTITGTVDLTDYLTIMRRQRIHVQLAYVREKLSPGIGSPETRLTLARNLSWSITAATALLTLLFIVSLFWRPFDNDVIHAVFLSTIALIGVFSVIIRVVTEGYHLRGERDRYIWYREALEEVDAQFHNPDPRTRLQALREVEELSYRELREFLKAHDEAKFGFA